ncbi:unnamed protein product [Alopecurus aequalis]
MAKLSILFLLALALVAANPEYMAAAAPDDDDLAQRQEYMAEVLQFGANPELAVTSSDAEKTHRLGMFLQQEMGEIQKIFHAISRMPESRVKDDAFDAAMELLDAKFRVLLPQFHPKADDDVGFAIRKMPENTAEEVRAKEEARASAKEIIFHHLGPLFSGGSSVKVEEDL